VSSSTQRGLRIEPFASRIARYGAATSPTSAAVRAAPFLK